MALPGVNLATAQRFAERLGLALAVTDWTTITPNLHVTVSFGVACGPALGWQSALDVADRRLLAAKRHGRSTVITTSIGALSA